MRKSKLPVILDHELKSLVEEAVSNNDLLIAISNQLSKDVSLCGLQGFSNVRYSNFFDFFQDLSGFIHKTRIDSNAWLSLLYRIDLPKQIDSQSQSDEEMAIFFIVRTIQKIKFRKQFSVTE